MSYKRFMQVFVETSLEEVEQSEKIKWSMKLCQLIKKKNKALLDINLPGQGKLFSNRAFVLALTYIYRFNKYSVFLNSFLYR